MAYTITNQNMSEINTLIRNYYNMFIVDAHKEIFGEMADIGSDREGSIPGDTTASSYSIQLFQKFIHNVVNNNISSDAASGYTANNGYIRIKPTTASNATFAAGDLPNLKFVFACMNIINVFVDILEAYKYFIDNDTSFKSKIQGITKIVLVPSTHRTKGDLTKTEKNIGYHINNTTYKNQLFLAINSLTATPINTIFTTGSTTDTVISGKTLSANGLFDADNSITHTVYVNQLADNSISGTFKINLTAYTKETTTNTNSFDDFQKKTLNNFLLFLATMTSDNARIQVHGLYYYYKYVQLYTTLVFSTMNVALNNSTLDAQYLMKVMNYTAYISGTNEIIGTTPYASDNAIFKDINASANNFATFTVTPAVQSGNAKNSAATIYDNAVRYVYTEIGKLIGTLYTLNIPKTFDNILRTNLSMTAKYDSKIEIKLDFTTLNGTIKNKLNDIINNTMQNTFFKENHVISYNGKYYKIVKLQPGYIYIQAKFPNQTDQLYTDIQEFEPNNWDASTHVDATTVYHVDIQIITKGLLALRGEYNSGKQYLRELNGEIRYNTSKINAQKNMYKYQQNTDTLLTNQTYAYTVIIGVIVFAVLFLSIVNVEKQTKQMAGMVFAGIIVLFFIVYYVINAAYIEEFKMKEGFFAISTASGLTSASIDDKKAFLQLQLNSINVRFIEYFQKVMNAIPLTESIDFYSELNGVIKSEKDDKTNIREILEFKRSLGNSSIDMLRYESNRKQIYISTLLVSAIIFIILYNVSLYSPSEYRNLIIFAGFIFAIIIFSYYLIFSSKTVRNRSNNKYWGPEFNKDM